METKIKAEFNSYSKEPMMQWKSSYKKNYSFVEVSKTLKEKRAAELSHVLIQLSMRPSFTRI